MIHLNCSTSNSRYQQGMNTIILPRAIALECKLNYTLAHLGSITGNALYGTDFYYTNSSQSVSSSHIVATISKSLTAAKAEEMLLDLTKNASGGRIGNNVTISTTSALYLLHLPRDVLSAIPSVIDNDGMGNMPDYLNMEGILSDIGDFLFDSLVFVASGGLLFLLLHMAEMGLKKLGQMLSAAATVVKNAVDEMAKALNNFVEWILDSIRDIATQLLQKITSSIKNLYDEYLTSVAAALTNCKNDLQSMGYVTITSKNTLSKSLDGDLYWAIIALAIIVEAVILIITGMTNIFGFILTLAVSLVIGYIIQSAFSLSSDNNEIPDSVMTSIKGHGSIFTTASNLNILLVTCSVDTEQIDNPQTKISAELAMTIFSAVVGQFASKVAIASLASSGWKYAWGMISIVAGFMAIIFGGLGATGDYDQFSEFIFAYTGIAFGVESIIFGLAATYKSSGFDFAVGLFGGLLGVCSLVLSLVALNDSNQEG